MCVLAAASSGGHDLEKLWADNAEAREVVLRVLGAQLLVAGDPEAWAERESTESTPTGGGVEMDYAYLFCQISRIWNFHKFPQISEYFDEFKENPRKSWNVHKITSKSVR